MTYNEVVEFIRYDMVRTPKWGLNRARELGELIGNPQNNLKFVHVAGTNGKGSTSKMIMNILSAAGYKTGLFTSPFLQKLNEKIQVNGVAISDEKVIELVEYLKPSIEKMKERPSEFEIITMMGMEYFNRCNCDIVVLEVGLGGRFDSTNLIDTPEVAVITSIGYDHMAELGSTLEEIATEKAGIIKSDGDVVFYKQHLEVQQVIEQVCYVKNSRLHIVDFNVSSNTEISLTGQTFSIPNYPNIFIPLLGDHQQRNTCVAIKVINILRDRGWKIEDRNIYDGLATVSWPARFELVSENPPIILDAGHNPQGFEMAVFNLKRYFPNKKITFVVGVLADKDYFKMMDIIAPIANVFYTITPNNLRALPSSKLSEYIMKYNLPTISCDKPIDGIDRAIRESTTHSVICILGSLSIAGDIRSYFKLTLT